MVATIGTTCTIAALVWMGMPLGSPRDVEGERLGGTVAAMGTPPFTPPSAPLWRPLSDAPVVVSAPPPMPAFRLLSLSQRQGRWIALIDSGGSTGAERVSPGDSVAGWRVEGIDKDGVDLSAGSQRHRIGFSP